MIKILKNDFQKIIEYALSQLPDEACGLIAGEINGKDKVIKKVYLLNNIDHSHEHFSIDPKEQLLAIKDMRALGYQLLGNWHSHPETPSRPSQEDMRLAFDKNASYLILSLMDQNHPIMNSFHIEDMIASKEEFIIEEEFIEKID